MQTHDLVHLSWLKNHMCVLAWISRFHARNRNEIQTSGRRGSAGNIEKLVFLIPVNPKHAWKSWNLAWCHDMAPTCCGNFLAELGQALVYVSCKPELPSKRLVVPRGNVSPPCAKWHTSLPSPALIFLHRKIRPNRSIVQNFRIIPGSYGLFYTLIEFLGI